MTRATRICLSLAVIFTVYWFYAYYAISNFRAINGGADSLMFVFPFSISWTMSFIYGQEILNTVGSLMIISWIAWGIFNITNSK